MKKILLIGDSIRTGYDNYVRMSYEGLAEVYYPEENCQFSSYVLRHMREWKNLCGHDVDVVHWNAGLWDTLVLPDGKMHVSIDTYRENIDRICTMIKILFPNAKMIFATSTACIEEGFTGDVRRFNKDVEEYNTVAVEVVKRHGGEVNDLYSLTVNAPIEWHSDQTHFFTKEATKAIVGQVIRCLENAIGIKANELNYDKIFADEKDVKGL